MPSPRRNEVTSLRSPYLVRALLTGKNAIAQMADDFRVINTRRGHVDREDLELLGWLNPQIDLHGTAARQKALAMEVRAA
jgi:hypothetical protein